ncbi:hypothetical protein D9C73_004552 [Collichthys lucidus]|uniref:Circadian-associated transcriptional repressor n=1 Tax=Collichthys lucidus TaxID=240159 RepID=A0A4U5U846_COLLU|nr:hypothetical protein D9C73_004552 [Collichthys lucidus]
MSTSDSDYSIDWLASDEDDYDSPKRICPEPLVPPPSSSSSSSSSSGSPTSCFHCEATQRRRRRRCDCCDCKDGGRCGVGALQSPALSPLQGFTSVYPQQELHPSRKRPHGAASDALSENPRADTEDQLFSQKCSELQRYIQPLSSILRGLRSGRYSQRKCLIQLPQPPPSSLHPPPSSISALGLLMDTLCAKDKRMITSPAG